MAQTVIQQGDPMARRVYGVGVFVESIRRSVFRKKLTGPVPQQPASMAKARTRSMQSSSDMPIVQITDLERTQGDTVTMDLFGVLTGEPIMGDKKAVGTGQPLHKSTMEISINQYRKVADPGGKMTRKRTVHDLRQVCRANLGDWFARCEDQLCLVHLAGARGTDTGIDWCIPLETSPTFAEVVVNPVMPPTPNRRRMAGNATGTADLEKDDIIDLEEIDKVRAWLDEMELPPMPCKIPDDPASQDDPVYLWGLTSRQWHYLETKYTSTNTGWRQFLAAAEKRAMQSKHPLFVGGRNGMAGIWNGIYVFKMNRAIRWAAGDPVKQRNADGTISTVNAAEAMDRSLLLGGQALGEAMGDTGAGHPMMWAEEVTDFGNALEIAGIAMGGKEKVTFTGSDNVVTDFGVICVDSYAPDPTSPDGAMLRG